LFSFAGIEAIKRLIPEDAIPREVVIHLNVPALLFTLAASVVTALLFGLAPALQISNQNFVEPLKDSGKGVSGGFRRGKLRSALVVTEVALSMILLVGAGLLMRSFVTLQTLDLGFNPKNVMVTFLPFPKGQYTTVTAKQQFFSKLLPRLRGLPGVISASTSSGLIPYGALGSSLEIPGKTHEENWESVFQLVNESYVETLGIRLLRGRNLSEADVTGARKVAVVNQTLVRKFLGDENPIGRQVRLKGLETVKEGPVPNALFEIVGVMADVRNQGVQEPPMPEVLIPYTITAAYYRTMMVRTAGDPMALANAVRREVWALDRNIALAYTDTIETYLMQLSYASPRFSFIMLGVFASVGLILVSIGVYSVIAYTVTRQTHEIGIRLALGAGAPDVFRMVLGMGLQLIVAGVTVGLLASLVVTRVLASQLVGVSQYDAMTLVGVIVIVTSVGLAACYFPAKRATVVDPLIALRYE